MTQPALTPFALPRALFVFLLTVASIVWVGAIQPGEAAAAVPSITSLSPGAAARSGRLIVEGSGFGAAQGTSDVDVGGVPALVTRWSDTRIAAYVPESTPLGATTVQVFTGAGASNATGLTVTTRAASGRVKWRFQADSDYILQRPAIGPDGTIVAHDAGGLVYALTPDGGLKWVFKTRVFAAGPPSVGADGTVYVADSATITAINPDGSLKWVFDEPQGGQGVMAGPTVGPDGNIYAITDFGGLGALALSPAGGLLWSNAGNPAMGEIGQIGAEIVFGPSRAGVAPDQFYAVFDPFTDPFSHLYAFRLSGAQAWAVPLWMSKYTAMMAQQQPAVGPDGTVYASAAIPIQGHWSLNAFDPASGSLRGSFFPSPGDGMSNPEVGPDGAVYFAHTVQYLQSISPGLAPRWQSSDGSLIDSVVASPTNSVLFSSVRPADGVPGQARAFSPSTGAVQWTYNLGSENGFNIVLDGRARFTPDGSTAYSGSSIPGQTTNAYSYLYAFDMAGASSVSAASVSLNPPVVTGGGASQGTVTLTGPAPASGAVVTLTSSNSDVARPPATVTVSAGATSAAFTVTTASVGISFNVTIGATYGAATARAQLTVNPGPVVVLSSLTLNPATVKGQKSSTGTVQLSGRAPSGGLVVMLSSSNTAVATVPANVTVPAGATSAKFLVTTKRVPATTSTVIGASYTGVTKTATLTVTR